MRYEPTLDRWLLPLLLFYVCCFCCGHRGSIAIWLLLLLLVLLLLAEMRRFSFLYAAVVNSNDVNPQS